MNKNTKRIAFITAGIIFISTLVFFVGAYRVRLLNESYLIEENATEIDDETDIYAAISRLGNLNQWHMTDEIKDITGATYIATVTNVGEYDISDWKMKITIPRDCYISSAWNGTVEVHQYRYGDAYSQNVDFKNLDEDALFLDYYTVNDSIYIYLKKDDYIVYRPNTIISENVIDSGSENLQNSSRTVGFNFFTDVIDTENIIDFTDVEIEYVRHKNLFSYPIEIIFLIIIFIGIVIEINCLYVTIDYRIKKNRHANDIVVVDDIMDTVVQFMDTREVINNKHSQHVAKISEHIAKQIGLGYSQSRQMYYCGMLHDCGKLKLNDFIIRNSKTLSGDELERYKKHTIIGFEMLKNLSTVPDACNAARYHHENFDGSGYPDGLHGDNIPLVGRIIAVADTYERLRENYDKRELPDHEDEIIKKLSDQKGSSLDPWLVEALLTDISEISLD